MISVFHFIILYNNGKTKVTLEYWKDYKLRYRKIYLQQDWLTSHFSNLCCVWLDKKVGRRIFCVTGLWVVFILIRKWSRARHDFTSRIYAAFSSSCWLMRRARLKKKWTSATSWQPSSRRPHHTTYFTSPRFFYFSARAASSLCWHQFFLYHFRQDCMYHLLSALSAVGKQQNDNF